MFCFWTLEGDFFGLGFERQKNRRLVSATKKKYLFGRMGDKKVFWNVKKPTRFWPIGSITTWPFSPTPPTSTITSPTSPTPTSNHRELSLSSTTILPSGGKLARERLFVVLLWLGPLSAREPHNFPSEILLAKLLQTRMSRLDFCMTTGLPLSHVNLPTWMLQARCWNFASRFVILCGTLQLGLSRSTTSTGCCAGWRTLPPVQTAFRIRRGLTQARR